MVHTVHRHVRHFFTPHHSNNYRARTLQLPFLLFYVLLVLVFQGGSFLIRQTQPNVLGYATNITIDRVFTLVNAERAKAGLTLLTPSPQLASAATQKGSDMFAKNYWAHISPVGATPWVFITSSGYQYLYAGENLAKSFNTAEEVVTAWMNSPTHRANILKPEYKEMGIAVLNGKLQGEETTLVVQEFGARTGSPATAIAAVPQPTVTPFIALVESTAQEVPAEIVDLTPTPSVPSQSVPIAGVDNRSPGGDAPVYGAQNGNIWMSLRLNRSVSFLIAEFLLVVLLIDGIYIWRKRTVRMSGHTIAHILFLAALLGAMGATGVGAIL